MHLGCCSTFRKRKNTRLWLSFMLSSESLATFRVQGSRYPARKTIWYSFNTPPTLFRACLYGGELAM